MTRSASRDDFIQFLDWVADKGLVPTNTASSRKSTASKVLTILSDEEATDVLAVDVEDVMRRFQNKNSSTYGPESIRTYQSRLKSSLEDFRSYCENPIGFRPIGRSQTKPKTSSERGPRTKPIATSAISFAQPAGHAVSPPSAFANVLPVMIRPDVTVQIGNLPHDLTEAEARRIANIVLAFAVPSN